MLSLKGSATGIGSLPHTNIKQALDLIFACTPHIPFWPQLPKRNIREGMIAQFCEGLPCIKVTDKGILFIPENKENELEKFYEKIIKSDWLPKGDLEHFRISSESSVGVYAFHARLEEIDLNQIEYIKCHITGPFTIAASIKDENGVALLHDPVFMQIIIESLKMKALWQMRFFWKFKKKIIMFIDEPYLGCFGSAYTPINREDVVRVLSELSGALVEEGAICGLHCCGNTDWSIFVDAKHIGIINFDAFSFLDKLVLYGDSLKNFTGDLCWGIIPTQEFTGQETVESLIAKINQGVDALVNKGLSKDYLMENLILSPSCGLGALDEDRAAKIFRLLKDTSDRMRGRFL